MAKLHTLKNTTRKSSNKQRVGRGPGSKRGKTSCRGEKGAGSRRGYKRRFGYEGGQMRLFAKLPHKGFTRGRFVKPIVILNFSDIDLYFNDGDVINLDTLHEKKLISKNNVYGLKILAKGDFTKKVTIEANNFSEKACKLLDEKKISYKVIK